jgi:hypothetical protein
MLENLTTIELYLRSLGVPEPQISNHVTNVTRWRQAHLKVKRHRLDCCFSADGHRLFPKRKKKMGRPRRLQITPDVS